jgi:hypothetical protein
MEARVLFTKPDFVVPSSVSFLTQLRHGMSFSNVF